MPFNVDWDEEVKSSGIDTGRDAGPNAADRCVPIFPAYGRAVAVRDRSHDFRSDAEILSAMTSPRSQLGPQIRVNQLLNGHP
jgi:hypothetical protein